MTLQNKGHFFNHTLICSIFFLIFFLNFFLFPQTQPTRAIGGSGIVRVALVCRLAKPAHTCANYDKLYLYISFIYQTKKMN